MALGLCCTDGCVDPTRRPGMFRPAPGHEEESYYVPCLFVSLFSLILFFFFYKKEKLKETPRQVYAQW